MGCVSSSAQPNENQVESSSRLKQQTTQPTQPNWKHQEEVCHRADCSEGMKQGKPCCNVQLHVPSTGCLYQHQSHHPPRPLLPNDISHIPPLAFGKHGRAHSHMSVSYYLFPEHTYTTTQRMTSRTRSTSPIGMRSTSALGTSRSASHPHRQMKVKTDFSEPPPLSESEKNYDYVDQNAFQQQLRMASSPIPSPLMSPAPTYMPRFTDIDSFPPPLHSKMTIPEGESPTAQPTTSQSSQPSQPSSTQA